MKDYKKIITDIIKELGVSANVKGYYYVRYSIELMVNDITLAGKITKVLYPKIAEEFNTTPARVERAIRHAIETGWIKANVDFADKLFGYTVASNKGNPTNSEFICTVADYIQLTEREKEVENNVLIIPLDNAHVRACE